MSGEMLDFIADTLGDAIPGAGLTRDATLIKTTEGGYTAGAQSGDTAKTTASYAAQGVVTDLAANDIDGTLVVKTDVQIALYGTTIQGGQVPARGDQIAIDGKTYRVIAIVGVDAAKARYRCAARA